MTEPIDRYAVNDALTALAGGRLNDDDLNELTHVVADAIDNGSHAPGEGPPYDLDFYCWRERVQMEHGERLLIPHSDPMLYEHPVDAIFRSKREAVDYRDEFHEDETGWVLVHYVGSIVDG